MVAKALIKSILRPLKESYRVPPYEIHEYTILKYNNLGLHKQSSRVLAAQRAPGVAFCLSKANETIPGYALMP